MRKVFTSLAFRKMPLKAQWMPQLVVHPLTVASLLTRTPKSESKGEVKCLLCLVVPLKSPCETFMGMSIAALRIVISPQVGNNPAVQCVVKEEAGKRCPYSGVLLSSAKNHFFLTGVACG
jgi:hypothetical protein